MDTVNITSVVLAIFTLQVVGGCPDGWIKHDQSCYFFSHDTEGWTEAVTLCKLFGGSLVEIESATENDYLKNQVALIGSRFFIAAADLVEEGIWKWMNSGLTLVESGYTNWGPGEPNNYHNQGEDCGMILTNGLWNDGQCFKPERYICETPEEDSGVIIG